MKASLLMNFLWYEDISPDELANALAIRPEEFFRKLFGDDAFTPDEIRRIQGILAMTDEETREIFYQ